MSLTIAQKFHVHNARQFVESVTESQNDTYYLFVGRPTPWTNGDASPDATDDSVQHTSYEYLRDALVFVKIRPEDLTLVAPRYDWVSGTKYTMYDHTADQSELVSNTTSPYYVVTSNYDVFKCIYDGRPTQNGVPVDSTIEPSILGQSDLTAITSAGDYRWKFLYNIPLADRLKYMNESFIPVQSVGSVRDTNNISPSFGDVYDDGSTKYQVFHAARQFGNGAIYEVVLTNRGAGYATAPTVTIVGDGTEATAQAFLSGDSVSRIQIISPGRNYSTATVTIQAPASGSNTASATAIISPRSSFANDSGTYYLTNHGIDLEEELCASYVMLHSELTGTMGGIMTTGNQYRRVGIIRNPVEYGTSQRANTNVYSQMTILTLPPTSGAIFTPDELVWQVGTNAYGIVVDSVGNQLRVVGVGVNGQYFSNTGGNIIGIGNGSANGYLATPSGPTIPSYPGPFTPIIPASGNVAAVIDVTSPGLEPFTGDVLYVNHRAPITRDANQQEVVRTILAF